MARYKEYNYSQGKFIPIFFDKQILPGTFEHTLHYLIDEEFDLSIFEGRYMTFLSSPLSLQLECRSVAVRIFLCRLL